MGGGKRRGENRVRVTQMYILCTFATQNAPMMVCFAAKCTPAGTFCPKNTLFLTSIGFEAPVVEV
jgi:hypothetical protein